MATRIALGDKSVRSWCRPQRQPQRKSCCVVINTPPDRPDPATYSQDEQLALGLLPTWNSPDIVTNHNSPYTLFKEPEFKIRNLSARANAVNVLVHVSTSAFGIGMQRTPLSTKVISLAPLQEVTLLYPLSQALLSGDQRIGVHVVIEHPHDKNLFNSRASQIAFAVDTSNVGRDFQQQFPVLNLSGAPRQLTLSVLANYLSAIVTPTVRNFAPFEQIQATLNIEVPNSLHGTPGAVIEKEVTVIGRGPDGSVIDGITYLVRIDN
jgi:hypothetical protein